VDSICRFIYGEQVLKVYRIDKSEYWYNIIALASLAVGFRVVAVSSVVKPL
jgi:hypothetical protein